MDSITIGGKEYKFKRVPIRLWWEVEKLNKEAAEVVGLVDTEEWDDVKQCFVSKKTPPNMLGIILDEQLAAKYLPFWVRYCDLVFDNPDEAIKDLPNLLTEEVEKIREGFRFAAAPILRRLAALNNSDGTKLKTA